MTDRSITAIASYQLDITSFDCSDIGSPVTVTLTVTDVNGNDASNTAVVTVIDVLPPVVVTQDITVQLNADGTATITAEMIDDGSSDNCEIDTYELDITSFTCADVGENTVTLTVTDIHGNCSQ
jgi:hypothetical protein